MLQVFGFLLGVLWIVVIIVAILSRRGAPSLGPALVLREFHVNDHATEGSIVQIRGRVAGLTAWLLTTIGVDTETQLAVTTDRFSLQKASLSGREVIQVPLATIASTYSAYYQPVWALLLAGIYVASGLVAAALDTGDSKAQILLASLIMAAVFGAIFVLGRKIGISIETSGGSKIGVAFKPSVIEGVSVNLDNALRVAAVLNNYAMRAAKLTRASAGNPVAEHGAGRPTTLSQAADDTGLQP